MKLNLLFSFLLIGQFLSAQSFTEVTGTSFPGITGTVIAADVDGDNDQDVFIAGFNGDRIAKLFANDGIGNFTEIMNPDIETLSSNTAAFADVDGDNDQDLFIAGFNGSDRIAKLYTNDGSGIFTESTTSTFEGVRNGTAAFADIDGDNDQDLMVIGQNSSDDVVTILYENDGSGNFVEVPNNLIANVESGDIAFADVDGDNDEDFFITGRDFFNFNALYINNGLGNFTAPANNFDNVQGGSAVFADIDGDNDQDLIVSGEASQQITTQLYTNDGSGDFTLDNNASFVGVFTSDIAFSDVDGDNDQDVLVTGRDGNNDARSILYVNDGNGNFTEATSQPFESVKLSSVVFADIDGDNDEDVIISGQTDGADRVTKLYLNTGFSSSVKDLDGIINFDFTLFPNPTKATEINVRYNSEENGFAQLNIYDLNGRLLKQKQDFLGRGRQVFSMDISTLENGFYMLEINDGEKSGVQKFIIR